MGETIMTQETFMNYMATLVPLCAKLQGNIENGSLA